MRSTDVLREEHRQIKRMLRLLNCAADQVRAGGAVPVKLLAKGVAFLREYTDKSHHGKEEDLLFPRLMEKGLPEGGPVTVMLTEHVSGREYVSQIDSALSAVTGKDGEALDSKVREDLASAVENYTSLLARHIQKENMILFNLADQMLSGEEDRELYQKFCDVDEKTLGQEKKKSWQAFLDAYEERLGLPEDVDEEVQAGCLAFLQDPEEAVGLWKKELDEK